MRNLILSLVLGLGAIGIVGATPSSAKAFWIMTARGPVNVNLNQFGAHGAFTTSGMPIYRPIVTPWGVSSNYFYPASYHFAYGPSTVSSIYRSPSMMTYSYNAWYGYLLSVTSPAYFGYSYSPYAGLRRYAVPSVSYTLPARYYSGYLGY